jgi:peroxiredoxin
LGQHSRRPWINATSAFSKLYEEFKRLGVNVFGLSFQNADWQKEFVTRTTLLVPLLSDHEKHFFNALALPTFIAGAEDYLRRITLMSEDGFITQVRYPVSVPENDAAETLKLIGNAAP